MLSYRHLYHAGNYADVLKHVTLVSILDYLVQKEGPIRYIDTHAGAGAYNLRSEIANQTAEYLQGITRLWSLESLPPSLLRYRSLVKQLNTRDLLDRYPGSPWFAQQILREQDRLELCELHPKDYPHLVATFKKDKRVHCLQEDGFAKSLALLPPIEKRGLVLIDPSYELKEDYDKVVTHIVNLHRRFSTGVYALWYPVVDLARIQRLERKFTASGLRRVELYELRVASAATKGMSASGMIVVNPPWTLKQELSVALEFLAPLLQNSAMDKGEVSFRVKVLVGE